MRASLRIGTWLSLLMLLIVGFSLSTRVCGAEAMTADPRDEEARGQLITSSARSIGATPEPVVSATKTADAAPGSGDGSWAGRSVVDYGLVTAAEDGLVSGELQVHNVTVWDGMTVSPHLHISFAPISLEQLFGDTRLTTVTLAGEEVEVADVAPELDEEHVRVTVDGALVRISSLSWYYAGYGDLGGSDTRYMPVCVIQIERPQMSAGAHRMTVEIEDVRTGASGSGNCSFDSVESGRGI